MKINKVCPLTVVLIIFLMSLSAGCSSKRNVGEGRNNIDITKLSRLNDYFTEGMRTLNSSDTVVGREGREKYNNLLNGLENAQVYPAECESYTTVNKSAPLGTRVSTQSAIYEDTVVTISVVELPEAGAIDIDHELQCTQNVVISDRISVSMSKNTVASQQIRFENGRSVALNCYAELKDGTNQVFYQYVGWWDKFHYIQMSVNLFGVEAGEDNIAPDVYPALDLWDSAVGLVEGSKV